MDRFPADFDFLCKVIFDPTIYPTRLNQAAGADMLWTSASNYYSNVRQHEAEQFYTAMAAADAGDPCPVSYGLNSQLVKEEKTGRLYERTWKVGGMYSPAIERIVYWLEKARDVAAEPQKQTLAALIDYYRTGDLKQFDRYNILWLQDTVSNVDFVNGFIETYGDPLGYKASWEANVNFVDSAACRRTRIISENAQWFEDHSPVDPAYKKKVVKGVSAKVITVAMLGGDCYPATPIGINLPNADWIRKGARLEIGDDRQHHLRLRPRGARQRLRGGVHAAPRRPRAHRQIRQDRRRPPHRPARMSRTRFGPAGTGREGVTS